MRIIRIKLKTAVSEYLQTLCVQYKFNDLSFAEDLYALALSKGGALPDNDRLAKLIDAYSRINEMPKLVVKTILNKRRQVLRDLAASPLFQVMIKRTPAVHPRVITVSLLEFYVGLYRRIRQSQCMTCQYMASCNFGQTYGSQVVSVHAVIDPDYSKKVHPDCPEKPTMDLFAQLAEANAQVNQMANNPAQLGLMKTDPAAKQAAEQLPKAVEDAKRAQDAASQDGETTADTLPRTLDDDTGDDDDQDICGLENMAAMPSGMGSSNSSSFGTSPIRFDMNTISKIKMHSFLLFELSRKLSSKLARAHKGKFKPTIEITKHQKTQNIKTVSDVTRILPSEHAQDDAVFDAKLQRRQLNMRQSQQPDAKKHLLYILLDTSESMTSCVGVGRAFWTVVSRAVLAGSFSIALLDLIQGEDGIVFIRGFDGSPAPLRSARSKVEFDHLRTWVTRCHFNGDSTDIVAALTTAANDIQAAKDELKDAEILLITDCGAMIDADEERRIMGLLGKTVLNTLDVASSSSGVELAAGVTLRRMSDHYFKVDASATTLDKMVNLVGGAKMKGTQP